MCLLYKVFYTPNVHLFASLALCFLFPFRLFHRHSSPVSCTGRLVKERLDETDI
jgi:alpha-N-acetylglucosamine transferase